MLNDLTPIMDNLDRAIANGLAAAAKPIRSRCAYRVCLQVAKRQDKMAFLELESLINAEMERDDAFESIPNDGHCCPSCLWIGSSDDAEFPLLRRGGPFSGPMDGATPPEHDDAKCPRCGAYCEDVT